MPKSNVDLANHTICIDPDIVIQDYVHASHIPLLSAMQFKRYLDKDPTFLCIVKPVNKLPDKKLSNKQHPATKRLLQKYSAIFPNELPKNLPPSRPINHKIDIIPGSIPPLHPTYPLSLTKMNELKKQLDDLLLYGFIHPSHSPYEAPVLFNCKKDGDLYMCVDYRTLNK
jgi:hypothetical protein